MPVPTKLTVAPESEHTLTVDVVTLLVPSPVVDTVGVNEPPVTAEAGMLVIVGVLGVAWPTVTLCGEPSAALNAVVAETWAVSVQVPTPTKLTVPELTVHTLGVDEVTDFVPSLFVDTVGVKLPP